MSRCCGQPGLGSACLVLLAVSNVGGVSQPHHPHKGAANHQQQPSTEDIGGGGSSFVRRSLQTCSADDGFTVTSEAFPLMEGCFEAQEVIPTGRPGLDVMAYRSDTALFRAEFDLFFGFRWAADYYLDDDLVNACRTIEQSSPLTPADETLSYECDLDGDGVLESGPVTDDVLSVTCGCASAATTDPSPAPSTPAPTTASVPITASPVASPTPSPSGGEITTPGPSPSGPEVATPGPVATVAPTGFDSGFAFSMAPTAVDDTAAPTAGSRTIASAAPTGSSINLPSGSTTPSATPSPSDAGVAGPPGIALTGSPAGATGSPSAAGLLDGGIAFSVAPTAVVAQTGAPTAGSRDFGSAAPTSRSDDFATSASSRAPGGGLAAVVTVLTTTALATWVSLRS